jgi:hypothetical protein
LASSPPIWVLGFIPGLRGRLWGFIHLHPLLASLPLRIWRRRSAALDEDDLDRLAEFLVKHLSWLEEAGFQDARDEATDVLASNPRLLPPNAHRNLEAAMHTAVVSMTAKFD